MSGKRNPQDFAIWRTSPPGENRQMEWDSPWGRGAPGWHLECSVMSLQHLGHPFDIHTGGIDHREIHHPNEIAQNQAYCGCADSGAAVWMHNNFLVDRRGKMSKSTRRVPDAADAGGSRGASAGVPADVPEAHYRSELEFTWEGLGAALTRLKRLVQAVEALASAGQTAPCEVATLSRYRDAICAKALGDDLNTAAGADGRLTRCSPTSVCRRACELRR